MTNSRFSRSEKSTDHFVKSQFPEFFLDEGEGIVNFVDAYYRHFSANTGYDLRDLQVQGDIDTTSNTNLIKFSNKYSFGAGRFIRTLPAVTNDNFRFLLKHIKDLYRSKGTVAGTKLFFRLSFDDAPEIFFPGERLFKPSSSQYNLPVIVEIFLGQKNTFDDLVGLVGREIKGSKSNATAIVGDIFKKRVKNKEFTYFKLDNVNGAFVTGDRIVEKGGTNVDVSVAPRVIGPVNGFDIISGSSNIPQGTLFTAKPNQSGEGLSIIADKTGSVSGTFNLSSVTGDGYSSSATVLIVRHPDEPETTTRGKFEVVVGDTYSTHDYNSDLILTYNDEFIANATINGTTFDSANASNEYNTSGLNEILTYESRTVGTISAVNSAEDPSMYDQKPFVGIKELVFTANQAGTVAISGRTVTGTGTSFEKFMYPVANTLSGTVSLTDTSATVTGTSTLFQTELNENDVLKVMDTSSNPRLFNIKSIESNTSLTLQQASPVSLSSANYTKGFVNFIRIMDGNGTALLKTINSHSSDTELHICDEITTSEMSSNTGLKYAFGYIAANTNFDALSEPTKRRILEGGIPSDTVDAGVDADIAFTVTASQGTVIGGRIQSSGLGFFPDENIVMQSEDLTPVVEFAGSGTGASGLAILNNGAIDSVLILNGGSGYGTDTTVKFVDGTGTGAKGTATVVNGVISAVTITASGSDYFPTRDITVRPIKGGQGELEGFYGSCGSEINPINKIQDSDFWQDYSYEIQSTIDKEKYKNIYDEFLHIAGRKFFSKNLILDNVDNAPRLVEESVTDS